MQNTLKVRSATGCKLKKNATVIPALCFVLTGHESSARVTATMKGFTVTGDTPEKFMRKIERALAKGELGKFAKMTLELPTAKIGFEKMGVTEFTYTITSEGDTFVAKKTAEKVALTHAFFRSEVERELERIIHRFGGIIAK